MQERYRPYRWGNRIAVGVLVGQLLGMAHSPLAFPISVPGMVQTAMARVASNVGDPPPTGEVEVELPHVDGPGVSVLGTSLAAPAPDPKGAATTAGGSSITTDPATSSSGGRPGGRTTTDTTAAAETSTTRRSGSPSTTRRDDGPTTTGRPSPGSTAASSTTGFPTTATTVPTTASTVPTSRTTVPTTAPTTSTTDDDLPPVFESDPCKLPPAAEHRWAVTVRSGDEATVRLRRDVVAAATAIAPEAFTLGGPATWFVRGPASSMCVASKLVEVVAVNRMPDQ